MAEVKEVLSTEGKIDEFLLARLLKASSNNVKETVSLYAKRKAIRQKWKLDTVLAKPPKEMLTTYDMLAPHAHHGFSKDGYPIYIQKIGAMQMTLFNQLVSHDQLLFCHAYDMELSCKNAREQSAKMGRNIDKFCNILDIIYCNLLHVLRHMKSALRHFLLHFWQGIYTYI